MERIQAAIEKARGERQGMPAPAAGPGEAAPPKGTPVPTGVSGGILAAAWAALSPCVLRSQHLARNRIITPEGGMVEASAFSVLRTRVLQQMRANGWKRLAITSPSPGCGKTTIALNLGFGIARQPDLRVVVGELDLRRPAMTRILGQEAPGDFSEVIAGRASFGAVAKRSGENLALAMNRGPVRNPAELLQSPSVSVALAAIETQYQPDLMIFDMPPMLVSDDAMAFMGQVDCVLIIAAAEMTSVKQIDLCEREAAGQTNVMGVILNKCRHMGQEFGYDYYG